MHTLSDSNGYFHFAHVFPGSYTVAAKHPRWRVRGNAQNVDVLFGNVELSRPFIMDGFDITGSIDLPDGDDASEKTTRSTEKKKKQEKEGEKPQEDDDLQASLLLYAATEGDESIHAGLPAFCASSVAAFLSKYSSSLSSSSSSFAELRRALKLPGEGGSASTLLPPPAMRLYLFTTGKQGQQHTHQQSTR